MVLFFGLIGIVNLVAIPPFLFLAHFSGIEQFSVPSLQTIGLLTLNGLIGTVVSDYLWARSVLLLSPLISTLGLSLTIPCSLVAQNILFNDEFSPWYLAGASVSVIGFVMINIEGDFYPLCPIKGPICL